MSTSLTAREHRTCRRDYGRGCAGRTQESTFRFSWAAAPQRETTQLFSSLQLFPHSLTLTQQPRSVCCFSPVSFFLDSLRIKAILSRRYNCNLQMFPLSGVKRHISRRFYKHYVCLLLVYVCAVKNSCYLFRWGCLSKTHLMNARKPLSHT